MKKIFLITYFLILSSSLFAQFDNKNQTLKTSSSGINFNSEGKPEVNLYQGAVNISNPLGTIEGRNGSEIPVYQSYQSSGIKVQDYASIIGLGWKLNVISSITRNVRGLPDENSSGFFGGSKGNIINNPLTQTIMNQVANGDIDTEPDQFIMNINGAEMEFVFNKDGIPNFLNQNDFYFSQNPFQQNGNNLWIVKDILGNQYTFGSNSDFIEISNTIEHGRQNAQISKSFTSTWYLKNIYLQDKNENFNYTYFSGEPVTYKYYKKNKAFAQAITSKFYKAIYFMGIRIRDWRFETSINELINEQWDASIYITNPSPKYLQEITSSKEKLLLTYTNFRQDLSGAYALSNIDFKTIDNKLIKKLEFITSYLSSTVPLPLTDKRMMLNKIKQFDNQNARSIDLYSYEYNQNKLPARFSFQKDHWGYFTSNCRDWFPADKEDLNKYRQPDGISAKACMLESITYPTGGKTKYYFESNDYYNPITKTVKLGGGLRVYKIEKFSDQNKIAETINYNYKNEDNLSSGRISLEDFQYTYYIDNESSQAIALNRGFGAIAPNYTVGTLGPLGVIIDTNVPNSLNGISSPKLPFNNTANAYINTFGVAAINLGIDLFSKPTTSSFTSSYIVTSSEPLNDMSANNSGISGYSTVSVFHSDNGKEVNKFTDINDYPDSYLQFTVDGRGKQFTVQNNQPVYLSSIAPPFTPVTSQAFARGLLKEKLIYDNNGLLLDKKKNTYLIKNIGDPIPALRCFLAKIQSSTLIAPTSNVNLGGKNVYYNVGTYNILRKTVMLDNVLNELPVSSSTSYIYDSEYPSLITKENSVNSDGNAYEKNYFYLNNATNNITYNTPEENTALTTMQSQKQWGVSLGESTKANNILLQASKIGFKNSQGIPLPYNNYESLNSGAYKLKTKEIQYDNYGRMVSFVDDKLIANSIIYNGSNENIKVKAANAFVTEIFSENFEVMGNNTSSHTGNKANYGTYQTNFTPPNSRNYILTYWYLENSVWKFSGPLAFTNQQISGIIDDVNVYPKDAMLTTFTYGSANQVSSEINPLNQTTYYEYDSFGRIQNIKNQDRNIIKAYCYNYAGDPTACFSCEGEGKKNINGICETGQKVNCSSSVNTTVEHGTSYICHYRYLFSDGSYSGYFTQASSTNFPCCNNQPPVD